MDPTTWSLGEAKGKPELVAEGYAYPMVMSQKVGDQRPWLRLKPSTICDTSVFVLMIVAALELSVVNDVQELRRIPVPFGVSSQI